MLETKYSGFEDQYHACWCYVSRSRQSISRHTISLYDSLLNMLWVGVRGFSKVVATSNYMGGSFNLFMWPSPGMSEWSNLFIFEIMCCMLCTFHVSSQIVANISESNHYQALFKLLGLYQTEDGFGLILLISNMVIQRSSTGPTCLLSANVQRVDIFFVFCWKNFHMLSNFSASLNLFLIRLNIHYGNFLFTLVGPIGIFSTPSGNSSRFFSYYQNRKLRKEHATTTRGREKIECFGD